MVKPVPLLGIQTKNNAIGCVPCSLNLKDFKTYIIAYYLNLGICNRPQFEYDNEGNLVVYTNFKVKKSGKKELLK